MAREADVLWLNRWFGKYAGGFYLGEERFDAAIRMKIRHTKNVVKASLDISGQFKIDFNNRYLARIIAILHDIGRFEQYARHHTYSDAKSENHALLGVKVIKKTGVLGRLCPEERDLIIKVVSHHNRAFLPASGDARFLFHLKLLRDADKIDIWRVVTDHYRGIKDSDAVEIGLPDLPEVSGVMCENVAAGTIARAENMKTLNDYKILQLGWIFDLNFPRAFQTVKRRKYLERIREALPDDPAVSRACTAAMRHLESNCALARA
jgi:putative nucleotidyltransferase with HDIG domain